MHSNLIQMYTIYVMDDMDTENQLLSLTTSACSRKYIQFLSVSVMHATLACNRKYIQFLSVSVSFCHACNVSL